MDTDGSSTRDDSGGAGSGSSGGGRRFGNSYGSDVDDVTRLASSMT